MTILHISDTHGMHGQLTQLPEADVVVHSGDFTFSGSEDEAYDFMNWFCDLPCKHKIFIAGNHDMCMYGADKIDGLPENVHYLSNTGVMIDGVMFWGVPMFIEDCADGRYEDYIRNISDFTDVLITHQPPKGICDQVDYGKGMVHYGDPLLAERVRQLHLQCHLFGHEHDSFGVEKHGNTTYSNGALVDSQYNPITRVPNVFEVTATPEALRRQAHLGEIREYLRVDNEKRQQQIKQDLMDFGLSEEEADAYIEQVCTSIPSLKGRDSHWLRGVVRWSLSDFDITQPDECGRISRLLHNLQDLPLMDDYDENFNGLSPEDIIKAARLDIDGPEYHTPKGADYTVCRVTFKDLAKYEGRCDWCILTDEIYNAYKQSGISFVIAERNDWRDVPRCKGEDYPYDSYGMSLIAVGIKDGKIDSVTSRWNLDEMGDHYLTPVQLERLLGEKLHQLGI